jgi:hypothetical protein
MASPLTTVDSVTPQRAGHTLASFLPAIIGSAIPITNADVTADKMGISIKVSTQSTNKISDSNVTQMWQ